MVGRIDRRYGAFLSSKSTKDLKDSKSCIPYLNLVHSDSKITKSSQRQTMKLKKDQHGSNSNERRSLLAS